MVLVVFGPLLDPKQRRTERVVIIHLDDLSAGLFGETRGKLIQASAM